MKLLWGQMDPKHEVDRPKARLCVINNSLMFCVSEAYVSTGVPADQLVRRQGTPLLGNRSGMEVPCVHLRGRAVLSVVRSAGLHEPRKSAHHVPLRLESDRLLPVRLVHACALDK